MRLQQVCGICCLEFDNHFVVVREILVKNEGTFPLEWKSIKVDQALSSVYKLNLLDQLPNFPMEDDEDDAEIVLCGPCASLLTSLYSTYEKLNRRFREYSYVGNKIINLDRLAQHLQQGEEESPPTSRTQIEDDVDNIMMTTNETVEISPTRHDSPPVLERMGIIPPIKKMEKDSGLNVFVPPQTSSTPLVQATRGRGRPRKYPPSSSASKGVKVHQVDAKVFAKKLFQGDKKKRSIHSRKKFVCEECNLVCRSATNLVVHGRTHTGEKPYECLICGYRTAQSSNLNSHSRAHHLKEEQQEERLDFIHFQGGEVDLEEEETEL